MQQRFPPRLSMTGRRCGRAAATGFTLIELMVVLAIVAILAGVAYPSYLESVKRARRSEARIYLLEAQQFMARFYSANSRYTTDEAGTTSPALPARLQSVPADAPRYTLSVTATANGYTLTATPMGDDDCGDLTLTHTGAKGRSGQGPTVAECWR